jgi:hypothetical protein
LGDGASPRLTVFFSSKHYFSADVSRFPALA